MTKRKLKSKLVNRLPRNHRLIASHHIKNEIIKTCREYEIRSLVYVFNYMDREETPRNAPSQGIIQTPVLIQSSLLALPSVNIKSVIGIAQNITVWWRNLVTVTRNMIDDVGEPFFVFKNTFFFFRLCCIGHFLRLFDRFG